MFLSESVTDEIKINRNWKYSADTVGNIGGKKNRFDLSENP